MANFEKKICAILLCKLKRKKKIEKIPWLGERSNKLVAFVDKRNAVTNVIMVKCKEKTVEKKTK